MPVKAQAVDHRVTLVGFNKVQGNAEVSRLDGAKLFIGEDFAISGQLAEQGLADIGAHLGQAAAGVLRR